MDVGADAPVPDAEPDLGRPAVGGDLAPDGRQEWEVGGAVDADPHVGAAATSVIVALLLSFLPPGTGVLFAGLAAMAVGAEIERRRA